LATSQTPFEALGDRRFQLFAQSLLSYEFPDLQALPVGQPDGGRDGLVYNRSRDGFIVFQVKFVERPDYVKDVPRWLANIFEHESAKIGRLISSGATSYVLVTNVPGSAHPTDGSIDQGNVWLNANLSIPGQILWRTDLEIRLAKHRALKWQYRELLTGQDVLEELVVAGLSESRARRRNALAAAMAAQYRSDRTVRFKQVDLQHELVDLFVDAPLARGEQLISAARQGLQRPLRRVRASAMRDAWLYVEDRPRGAADVLLENSQTNTNTRIVIEGAPGQGKSTLAQYVCQVHRCQLLGKSDDLQKLPPMHRTAGTRLPFKVDLRELAVFFKGEDPFESVTGWGGLPKNWPRSLEGFLAAQVQRYSGGADFDVSDLLAVAATGPVLLMLDGLDEVADIADRRMIVDTVTDGLAALEGVASGLLVVVTSRPPSFASSPGFSPKDFHYTSLVSLTPELIIDYCDRWAAARRLASEEIAEVRAILDRKLDEPHMRDLARNPMQLAILLSLINTKGESLPDKRTQLYSGYMDLFFDRESTKSRIVRDNRELLYGLHGYLAWILHSGAERAADKGSIALEDLKKTVASYLDANGADTALTDDLFHGVVDRIIAVTATRQERFEFEVQPLREFFAAFHLYCTAQVSQLGVERPGTLADRFDAMARHPFWLNVARFYAGFYTSGELPSLADRLQAFENDPDFALTRRPRDLSIMLLADWSFSLERTSRERVIRQVVGGLGKRHVLGVGFEEFTLPKGSGRETVAAKCLELLNRNDISVDRRSALITALRHHTDSEAFVETWIDLIHNSRGSDRTQWLRFGSTEEYAGRLSDSEIASALTSDDAVTEIGQRAVTLVAGGISSVVEESQDLAGAVIDELLESPENAPLDSDGSLLGALAQAIAVSVKPEFGSVADRQRLQNLPERPDREDLMFCRRIAKGVIGCPPFERSGSTQYWGPIVDVINQRTPNSWAALSISFQCASLSPRTRPRRRPVLTDDDAPLVIRVVEARAHSGGGAAGWWDHAFTSASTTFHRRLVSLCGVRWMTGPVLERNLDTLTAFVEAMSFDEFAKIAAICDSGARGVTQRRSGLSATRRRSLSPRLSTLMHGIVPHDEAQLIWKERLGKYRGEEQTVTRKCLELAFASSRSTDDWKRAVRFAGRGAPLLFWPRAIGSFIPADIAATIVKKPQRQPLWLIELAEHSLEAQLSVTVPLGTIARRERWFHA
jgi:hypothetical protein